MALSRYATDLTAQAAQGVDPAEAGDDAALRRLTRAVARPDRGSPVILDATGARARQLTESLARRLATGGAPTAQPRAPSSA